ncbi:glycosyltransferase [bacterium]|nr:glycosyltransferase [bacterium]
MSIVSDLAVVHPWLGEKAGSERVLLEILDAYPDAPLSLLWHEKRVWTEVLGKRRVLHSPLQNIPLIQKNYRALIPFLGPWAVSRLPVPPVKTVLSNCHGFAKGAILWEGSKHICYCYSPIRWLSDQKGEYRKSLPSWKRQLFDKVSPRVAAWEDRAAAGVDQWIAISQFVARRIKRRFGFESEVITPPVNTSFFTPKKERKRDLGYLLVSRLVPYKRVGTAVEAFSQSQRALTVVGKGDGGALARTFRGKLRLLDSVSDIALRDLYRRAKALIFTSVEDFGLVPLEAMACGTPVIALGKGGALETVVQNETGLFYGQDSPEALREALDNFEDQEWDQQACRERALCFSIEKFLPALAGVIEEA